MKPLLLFITMAVFSTKLLAVDSDWMKTLREGTRQTVTANDGATMTIYAVTPDAFTFDIEYKNFTPNEIIHFTSISRDETIRYSFPFKNFSHQVSPAVTGYTGGTATLIVLRNNEHLYINYDWGDIAVNKARRISAPQDVSRHSAGLGILSQN